MIERSKAKGSCILSLTWGLRKFDKGRKFTAIVSVFLLGLGSGAQASAQNIDGYPTSYTDRKVGQSEFDNHSPDYTKDWREAIPADVYEDTEFGTLLYNEASTPTKLEMLRLLSKDTPSVLVFLTAVSMGLDIESVLKASTDYQPDKSRDFAGSAVNVVPLLVESNAYLYSAYQLEDLEREDETKPYSVAKVIENFFKNRSVLRPYPDWFQGQYHFLASAAELKGLQAEQDDKQWYRSKSSQDSEQRPIFVSLYEHDQSVLIDGKQRIEDALKNGSDALLPVVFIFNRMNERAVDQLAYSQTIKGVREAYFKEEIMLTPSPEWQLGDNHFYAKVDEVKEFIDLPVEADYEPEAWQQLLSEAKQYSVDDTSFIFVLLGDGGASGDSSRTAGYLSDGQAYAAWDDPRTESAYPYVEPSVGEAEDSRDDRNGVSIKSVLSNGLIINRPDLVAALDALGVKQIPVSFYYLNSGRVKPYKGSARALLQSVLGLDVQSGTFNGGGITPPPPPPVICASPPCSQ